MRILGHIHTFNDSGVIDRSLQALLDQTRPLDGIIIVDNASVDDTLQRWFPPIVTVIRHSENRGTSGTVITGFRYALEHGYDWIWILDADSAPEKDALAKLIDLHATLPAEQRDRILALASSPGRPGPDPRREHHGGIVFTPRGHRRVHPDPGAVSYECDATVWSGCLFSLSAVSQIGLPPADYVLDTGEYEYGYRGKCLGYKIIVHQGSIFDHNIGRPPSAHFRRYRLGPLSVAFLELPPIRCYYITRNSVYFWLHEYRPQNIWVVLRLIRMLIPLILNFVARPVTNRRQLSACLRGILDGLAGRMSRRY